MKSVYPHLRTTDGSSNSAMQISKYLFIFLTLWTIINTIVGLPTGIGAPVFLAVSSIIIVRLFLGNISYRRQYSKLSSQDLDRLENILSYVDKSNDPGLIRGEMLQTEFELKKYREMVSKNPPYFRVKKGNIEHYVVGTLHIVPLKNYPSYMLQNVQKLVKDPNTILFLEIECINYSYVSKFLAFIKSLLMVVDARNLFVPWFLHRKVNPLLGVFLSNAGDYLGRLNPLLSGIFELGRPSVTNLNVFHLLFPTFGLENMAVYSSGIDRELATMRLQNKLSISPLETEIERSLADGTKYLSNLNAEEALKEIEAHFTMMEEFLIKKQDVTGFVKLLREELRTINSKAIDKYLKGEWDDLSLPSCLHSHPIGKQLLDNSKVVRGLVDHVRVGASARTMMWWPKLKRAFAQNKQTLIAVGEGHLSHLLNLMQQDGCIVERIVSENDFALDPHLQKLKPIPLNFQLERYESRITTEALLFYRQLTQDRENKDKEISVLAMKKPVNLRNTRGSLF